MANVKDIKETIYNRLISEGFTHYAAMGVIANFAYESDGFTAFEEYGFNKHGTKGAGIGMWTDAPPTKGAPRRTMYEAWMLNNKKDLENIDHQIDYFLYELENHPENMPRGRHMSKENLNKATSIEEAADFFMKGFESPADQSKAHLKKRLQHIADMTGKGDITKDVDPKKGMADVIAKPEQAPLIGRKKDINIPESDITIEDIETPKGKVKVEEVVQYAPSIESVVASLDKSLGTLSDVDTQRLTASLGRVIGGKKLYPSQHSEAAKKIYQSAVDQGALELTPVVENKIAASPEAHGYPKDSNAFAQGGPLQPNGRITSFTRPEDIQAQNNTVNKLADGGPLDPPTKKKSINVYTYNPGMTDEVYKARADDKNFQDAVKNYEQRDGKWYDMTFNNEYERAGKQVLERQYETVNHIPVYESGALPDRIRANKGGDAMIMDHSGDVIGGSQLQAIRNSLNDSGTESCYMGVCNGEQYAKELSGEGDTYKMHLTPSDNKWKGFNSGNQGIKGIFPKGSVTYSGGIKQDNNMGTNKHAEGGDLTQFNAGGSHEANPNGGIPQGMGANGLPNTVEQGETKAEDFVYSDNFKIPARLVKKYNLPSYLANKTPAEQTKIMDKRFEERSDSASQSTKQAMLDRIAESQERYKFEKEARKMEMSPDQYEVYLQEQAKQQAIAEASQGQNQMGLGGDLGSAAGMAAGTAIGGPIGGAIGSAILGPAGDMLEGAIGLKGQRDAAQSEAFVNQGQTMLSEGFKNGGNMYRNGGPGDPITKVAEQIRDISAQIASATNPEDKAALESQKQALIATMEKLQEGPRPEVQGLEGSQTGINEVSPESGIPTTQERRLAPTIVTDEPGAITGYEGTALSPSPVGYTPLSTSTGYIDSTTPVMQARANQDEALELQELRGAEAEYDQLQQNKLAKQGQDKGSGAAGMIGLGASLAPFVGNLVQGSQVEAQQAPQYARAGRTFIPNYADERSRLNVVDDAYGGMDDRMAAASAGNLGAYRSNILAGSLARTKQRAEAYSSINEINRGQEALRNEDAALAAKENVRLQNLEMQEQMMNDAAAEGVKSQYTAAALEGLGGIGETIFGVSQTAGQTDYNVWGNKKKTEAEKEALKGKRKANRTKAKAGIKKAGMKVGNTVKGLFKKD